MAQRNNEGWTIPDVIDPPESMEVTICIPKNIVHMKAFWGALWELTFWNNWAPDEAHSGTAVAAVWFRYYQSWQRQMSELNDCEDGMGKCCVPPVITRRINPETGLIEQSLDGGATWQPSTDTLQSVVVEPIPPVTSGTSATKCDAATNFAGQIDVWIDQVSNDFTTAESLTAFATAVFEAILAAILIALSAGTLTGIAAVVIPTLGAALAAAWGAGKVVFDAYWTTDVKDKILCAAFCKIGDDGSFTDAQFSAMWGKINTDLPASPAKMLLMGFLSSVGRQGANAMAATGMSADADCSDCECVPPNCGNKWHAIQGTILSHTDTDVTVEAGFDGANYYSEIQTDSSSECCIDDNYEIVSGTLTSGLSFWKECGSDSVVNGIPVGHSVWNRSNGSTVPYTIKYKFTEA